MSSFETCEVQPGNCKKEEGGRGEGRGLMQMVVRGQKRTQPGKGREGDDNPEL